MEVGREGELTGSSYLVLVGSSVSVYSRSCYTG